MKYLSKNIYIEEDTNTCKSLKQFCNDPNLGPEKFSPIKPNYIAENPKVFLFKMDFVVASDRQRLLGMAKPCRNVTGTATNSHHEREAIPPSEKRD